MYSLTEGKNYHLLILVAIWIAGNCRTIRRDVIYDMVKIMKLTISTPEEINRYGNIDSVSDEFSQPSILPDFYVYQMKNKLYILFQKQNEA